MFPLANTLNPLGSVVAAPTAGGGGGAPTDYVLYYAMNDADVSGTSLTDDSGNGHTGTLTGTTSTTGHAGQARNFNGTTDHIDAPTPGTLSMTGDMTISLWANFAVDVSSQPTFAGLCTCDPSPFNFGLRCVGGVLQLILNGSQVCSIAGASISTSTWHHLVFMFGSRGARLYLDGTLASSDATTSVLGSTSEPIIIGLDFQPGFGRTFNGAIDEVKMFSRALTDAEITALTAL